MNYACLTMAQDSLDNGDDRKLKKEYECVEVKHRKDVGKTIKEHQRNGQHLGILLAGDCGFDFNNPDEGSPV